MKIWLKSRGTDSELLTWVRRIISYLSENNVEVFVDPVLGHVVRLESLPESEAYKADLAVIVGGDGTLLRTVHKSSGNLPPIVGFTKDSVGFLLLHDVADYEKVFTQLFENNYQVEEVQLGEYEVKGINSVFLNEVAVWAHTGRLVELEISVAGERLYHLRADGVIVSTPAGSTGHALSYGAPAVTPLDVPLLEVVFAGALSPLIRPLVVYNSPVEIQVVTWPSLLVVDGQTATSLEYSSTVVVKPSKRRLKLITVREFRRSFNDRLRYRLFDRGLSRIL